MINIPEIQPNDKLGHKSEIFNKILMRGEQQEVYTDFERGPYMESRKSKITRVNRLYNLYNELSITERDKFINLIKSNIID